MEKTHDDNGKFAKGNKLGRGNPLAGKVAKLRAAMLEAVSESDVYAIITKLLDMAKDGDVQAAREILDRTIGKPQANDTLNITTDTESANPFFDYLRTNPDLARSASVLLRRMASNPGDDGVAPESGEMAMAGSPGLAGEQADGSSGDAGQEPYGDDAPASRQVGND